MKVFILSTQFLLILLDLRIIQGTAASVSSSTQTTTTTTSQPTTTICGPGNYLNSKDQQCTPCMKGFFKQSNGNQNCTACPKNGTTSLTGSTSISNCSIGTAASVSSTTQKTTTTTSQPTTTTCDPGHYLNSKDQQCTPCMKGFFKQSNGNQNCTACPKNGTTSLTGSTSISNCSTGTAVSVSSSTQTTTTTTSQPTTRLAPSVTAAPGTAAPENEQGILNPKIQDTNITMRYELVINIAFNETLEQKNSEEYNKMCEKFETILQKKFQNDTGIRDLIVKVKDFKNGSLIVQYEVIVPTLKNTTVRNLIVLDEKFKNAASNWTNYKQTLDGNVDSERTNKANKNIFLQSVCHCWTDEYVCVSEDTSFRCQHKCNSTSAKSCGKYGRCVYDRVSKEATCLCKHTESQIFFGEICEYSMLKTTTKVPTTPDPFPVSKLSIIAISGGTGGALLLIILISTICFCYRLKHAERKGSFSDAASKCDSDIIRDNRKMEFISLESGKMNSGYQEDRPELGRRFPLEQPQTGKSNPLYRDDFRDQRKGYQSDPEPRYQDHDRISRGSFNPQTSNDRLRTDSSGNRQPVKHYNDSDHSFRDQRESENSYRPRGFSSERNNRRVWPEEISRDRNNSNDIHYPKGQSQESSTGDDRYVCIEGDGGVRRFFKKVDDKDLGGETLIYQPSNMPRPIQRENVDSVGDNFIMRPAPPQDNERRSSFYDTIDSENPYKIKRPVIRHNNLYS